MGEQMQYGYFGHIAKFEKTGDGTLMVYGKAAGADLDLDGQRCDPTWLKSAMPGWHEWGNVREQHSNIAAGVGVELTEGDTAGDWWLKAEIVDPGTIRKVEKRVLKGFSVGIVNGRVIKSKMAPNGVIDDGTIAEISLVDRPCNPTATMSIAKSVGSGTLEPVEAESEPAPEVELIDQAAAEILGQPELAKSIGWYRDALRTVEDALTGGWSHTVPFITKAAKAGDESENADVAGAYAAIDKIADLIISEAQGLKGGNLREVRDIETLISAVRSLCCFIECELDEEGAGLGDDDVNGYDEPMEAKAYMKSPSAWDEPDDDAGHGDTPVIVKRERRSRSVPAVMPAVTSTDVDKAAGGSATVVDATTDMITKAVQAAQAEFSAAHEAELIALRAELEKALKAPMPGGPVTFKHVKTTSTAAPAQALTEADPGFWTALAANPELGVDVRRAYLAKAAGLNQGAST